MFKFVGVAAGVLTVGMVVTASHAAPVAMYGTYGETNGIIVNIPQNPPILPCVPPPLTQMYPDHTAITGMVFPSNIDLRPTGPKDARCHARNSEFAGTGRGAPSIFNKPVRGVQGARVIDGGLNVGDPFTVPPFAFQQRLGKQVGVVLNSVTRQLDTAFTAAMPGTNRQAGKQPLNAVSDGPVGPYTLRPVAAQQPVPALTRRFSAMNWNNPGNGQNNNANPTPGKPTPFLQRQSADFTFTHVNNPPLANEDIRVRYQAGPNEFGGTMTLLLDGQGLLWLGPPFLSGKMPNAWKRAAGTQPVGDGVKGYRSRNGDGFDNVHVGQQAPGKIKAFFTNSNPANAFTPMGDPHFGPNCTGNNPPTPTGCNEVNGFPTWMVPAPTLAIWAPFGVQAGGTVGVLPTANSDKHVFPLTTGTVSIVRVANRPNQGGIQTLTLTGMGYDTVGVTAMGAAQRNVGLVAGSYSVRTEILPTGNNTLINPQMLGVDLKFTPEPAASAALASALGLLGLLASRRRSN